MEIIQSASDITKQIVALKQSGKTIGFVPTMGALHEGHLSLIKLGKQQCDITIASIFVNPTQFNDKGDLKRYPRTPEADCKLLEEAGCDIVFMPTEQEIYPEPDTRVFDFGQLDKVMEGAHRPGHFNGVAQVVSRLFDIVPADKAFFGLKDFQQVAIIRAMVAQLGYKIEIVAAPIIRDTDGLALSSRNTLLNAQQRKSAPLISQTLFEAQKRTGTMSVDELKKWAVENINTDKELDVEYFDIVDSLTLQSVSSWDTPGQKFACVAVKVGEIRLIDNIQLQ